MSEIENGHGRRDFLRRAGAVAVTTAWAAPALQTLAAGPAAAGSAPPGSACLTGTVFLPDGVTPAPGVPVYMATNQIVPNPNGPGCVYGGWVTTTGVNGEYVLCLPPGDWYISAYNCVSIRLPYNSTGAQVQVAEAGTTHDFILSIPGGPGPVLCIGLPGSSAPCPPGG